MKFGIIDFDIWENTADPDFIDINIRSNVRNSWLSFDRVLQGKFKDSIIKPINKYAEVLYPMPVLLSATDNEIVLQQRNHAEIVVGYKDGKFHTVDKPHIRQYYKSTEDQSIPEFCFKEVFKFYMPWIIDAGVDISFEQPEDSPVFVYPNTQTLNKISNNAMYYIPPYVSFSFKNTGTHMLRNSEYGKILIGSPIFNIRIKASKEVIKRIEEFYEKEQ